MTAVTDAPSTRPAASPEYVSLPGAYLIAFLSRASGMGMIAMIGPYLLDRGVPVRFIGVVMVFSALGSAASGLVAGRVVDRFGPWRAMVGGLLTALAGVAVFVSVPWWPLLAPAYLITTGGSAASGNAVRTTIGLHAPPQRRERAFGTLNSVSTAGALLGPLLVGLVVIGGTVSAPWFAVGMLSVAALTSVFLRRSAAGAPPVPEAEAAPAAAPELDTRAVLRRVAPLIALVTTTATLYGVYAVVWGLYLRSIGASNLIIAWSFAATMVPVVLLSRYADRVLPRVSRWAVSGVATLLLGCLAFVYAITTTVWVAVAVSVVEGGLMAVSIPVTYSLITTYAPRNGLGRAFGVTSAADSLSSGFGTLVAGSLIAGGGIPFAFQLAGGYCVAGTAAALLWWRWRTAPSRARVGEAAAPTTP